jgi:hypothetical protein
MGIVYEAVDRRTQERVALKTLLKVDPASLYGFKQEFRTLADVHHRNLVRLQELVVTGTDPVFFTMELVAGVDFLEHVADVKDGARPYGYAESTTDGSSKGIYGQRPALSPSIPPSAGERSASTANFDKLRPALRQLIEGLHALHRAGKLHRDIKPSNVLVTPEGRVVLLDFGVATDLPSARAAADTMPNEGVVVGTPTYMSPEQAAGEAVTGATDMYSVGVMLYEALVGRPPFAGDALDVISRKMMLTPPSAGECVEGVPRDLDDLCTDLLRIDPAARPNSGDVMRLLGSTSRGRSDAPSRGANASLIGRASERLALREALDATLSGQAVTVRVSGTGGMGKSALVQSFVDDLIADGRTNILYGRVYERESVPYKAVDGVVDALSQLLVEVDEYEGGIALPRHMRELARLFPVLRRVQSLGPQLRAPQDDPQVERRRALRALRECLASLAWRRSLVVFIDDVQWGDTDSVALLVEVMRPPNAPPLLLVMTSREEDADTSPFLVEMAASWSSNVREIHVGPLPASEAHLLALSFLGSSDALSERAALAIVNEARGSPLLIEELVRSHRHRVSATAPALAVVTLEEMVGQRLDSLPPEARRLAEAVAVAGRPLSVATLAAAAEIEGSVADSFALLQDQGLARVSFRHDREVAEPVHDRIRETVVRLLPRDRLRQHHSRLAAVLETTEGADLEALASHMLGAGHSASALRFAERAAEEAASKLAFDQAARLLRMALDATSASLASRADAQRVRIRLAQVLERAGRASVAADEYATAARGATAIERIELERAAAEQLLLCGRIDEGKLALRRVLGAMGMSAPRSAVVAVLFLLFYQLRLRLVGLRFRERDAAEVSREDRVRVDTLHAVSVGMGQVDVILGACMQAKHLRVAMERGDRMQVLRALGFEIVQFALAGRPERRRERSSARPGTPARGAHRSRCRSVPRASARHRPLHARPLPRGAREARRRGVGDPRRGGQHQRAALRRLRVLLPRQIARRSAPRAPPAPRRRRSRGRVHSGELADDRHGRHPAHGRRPRGREAEPRRSLDALDAKRVQRAALVRDVGGDQRCALQRRRRRCLDAAREGRARSPQELSLALPADPGIHGVPARVLRHRVDRREPEGSRGACRRGAAHGAAARQGDGGVGADPHGHRTRGPGERGRRTERRRRFPSRGPPSRRGGRSRAARVGGSLPARDGDRRRRRPRPRLAGRAGDDRRGRSSTRAGSGPACPGSLVLGAGRERSRGCRGSVPTSARRRTEWRRRSVASELFG